MRLIASVLAFVFLLAPGHVQAQSATADPAAPPATRQPAESPALPGQSVPKPKPVRYAAFYLTEVTVRSQNAAERRGAMVRALGQVVVRLTGNPQAASNPVIRRSAGNIEALVTDSSFRQDSDTVNGVPVYKTVLSVTFDPENVDALIAAAGLRYWSNARPKPILWLAIDDGRGPRLVTGQQTAVVKPLAMRGLERGMRYLLPSGTATEQAAIPSILALNAAALQVLTSRYKNDAQLIGKVYRLPPGWAADWLLTQDGVELARWSFSDADPRKVIASGVDEGANALARRDGVSLPTGVAGVYSIDVVGVDNQSEFIRLMSYLETLAIVRKVTVVEAMPGQLRLQLDLSIGMRGFRTMIGSGTTLKPLSDPAADAATPGTGGVPRFGLQ